MSGEETPSDSAGAPAVRRMWPRILIAVGVAFLIAVLYQAVGMAVFLPHFASEDPREVVTAYFQARRWGLEGVSERALDSEVLAERRAPNYVDPLIEDVLLARNLRVSASSAAFTGGTWFEGKYDEVKLFTVTYDSRWRSEIGQGPGPRHWFVYAGRNPGEPWMVLGQGTGP